MQEPMCVRGYFSSALITQACSTRTLVRVSGTLEALERSGPVPAQRAARSHCHSIGGACAVVFKQPVLVQPVLQLRTLQKSVHDAQHRTHALAGDPMDAEEAVKRRDNMEFAGYR